MIAVIAVIAIIIAIIIIGTAFGIITAGFASGARPGLAVRYPPNRERRVAAAPIIRRLPATSTAAEPAVA